MHKSIKLELDMGDELFSQLKTLEQEILLQDEKLYKKT